MAIKYTHSVTLDSDKCKGCINCIKKCPTQAIRVRNGKAVILEGRCIDCGECVKVCPHHAKKAVFDKMRNRIGYGKGFYDRFLADKENLQLRAIGVGFACQLVEELPSEAWDIKPYQVICV